MKKLLIIMTSALVCVSAFGQGKLVFQNASSQAIYFTPNTANLDAGDASVAGDGLYTGGNLGIGGPSISVLTGSPTLIAALYGGTSASSLALVSLNTIGNADLEGQTVAESVSFASLPNGTPAFFQIQVFDSRATADDTQAGGGAAYAWTQVGWYAGESAVFTAVPQSSYSALSLTAVSCNLGTGTFNVKDYSGEKGLIQVYAVVPEPTSFALAGLGLATLLIFRRRK